MTQERVISAEERTMHSAFVCDRKVNRSIHAVAMRSAVHRGAVLVHRATFRRRAKRQIQKLNNEMSECLSYLRNGCADVNSVIEHALHEMCVCRPDGIQCALNHGPWTP